MFETYINVTAVISIIMAGIGILIVPSLLLIQYYIHRKILDPTYYNTNHFSEGELAFYAAGWIFHLSKSILYVRAIVLPKTMRIRFKEDILTFKEHPFVYSLAFFTILLIAYDIIALINLFVFFGFWEYYN